MQCCVDLLVTSIGSPQGLTVLFLSFGSRSSNNTPHGYAYEFIELAIGPACVLPLNMCY